MNEDNYVVAITTVDNPYNPFTQFDEWFLYDEQNGYHTCSYLDRISKLSDEMSDEEREAAIERAIDEIIKYDFTNAYKKVKITKEKLDAFHQRPENKIAEPINLDLKIEHSDENVESSSNLQISEEENATKEEEMNEAEEVGDEIGNSNEPPIESPAE